MTVADTRLIIASGFNSGNMLPQDAFSEGTVSAPWVTRVHFDDFRELSGVLSALDRDKEIVFSSNLRDYSDVIPCFTADSVVATKSGLTRISDLETGQQVVTRDNGLQSVVWVGQRHFGWRALGLNPHLRPIKIESGALGLGCPARDITVSPNHRMLVVMQGDERLIPAAELLDLAGVSRLKSPEVVYYQVLCANHELLLVDECWSESYHATAAGLVALDQSARAELAEFLPDLASGASNARPVRADISRAR
jgi:hypothetical protein